LDSASVRQVRQVLHQTASRGDTRIVVDLTWLGDRHELMMFALLVEAARQASATGGGLVVLSAPCRLATNLAKCDVRVLPTESAPQRPSGTLSIDLGEIRAPLEPRETGISDAR
jgi:hypothetical protein